MERTDESHQRGKPATAIFVNTREVAWTNDEIAFQEVYDLAYPDEPLMDGDVARVEYSRGHGRDGKLIRGQSVKVKKGMSFGVYVTVRS